MSRLGTLAAIWRYPVKSLAAEPLEEALIEPGGIAGDRCAALFVRAGHARAGKTFRGKEHNLLHLTRDPRQAQIVAANAGVQVELQAQTQTRYFDDAPISLLVDVWVRHVSEALGEPLDPLRWRPNLYVRATADFSYGESDLVGMRLRIGAAVLRVREPIGRCVTTTYDIATGERWDDVLTYVAQRRGNMMGVYCEVETPGTVRRGELLSES